MPKDFKISYPALTSSIGSEDTVQCTITPDKAGDLQLAIIALNGTVPSKTSLWTVIADTGESINPEEANRELGVALMILLGIAGIIVCRGLLPPNNSLG